jgi:peptidoglycan L-alanyl-D-glutamate endopeptidase CwlK
MASRSLDDLAPVVKVHALAFLAECRRVNLDVLIYCTLRSNEEQAELFKYGRFVAGHIRTNAGPGQSLHNPDKNGQSWAFDAIPLIYGKPLWGDMKSLVKMGACGERAGLEWAGQWVGSLREYVHFQIKRAGGS